MKVEQRAIIFDLDGVLCHTDAFHYEAWKQLADRLGIYFDTEINHRLRGVSRMESLAIILERSTKSYTEEQKQAFAAEKNERYCELLGQMNETHLSMTTKDTLDTLRAAGKRLAIGSSSKNARMILERIGLGDYFDAVADGTQIANSKPHPEVFLLAAKLLGEQPSDCLVVEDAAAGIEAAKAAGMTAVAIGDAVSSPLADGRILSLAELQP